MFDAMEHFVQVVESGSFSAAGKRLNKNPSSVARRIDHLEMELGTQLFSRSTRRLDLTLDGQSFYQQCLEILRSVQEARHSFQTVNKQVKGVVRISSLDSYGTEKLVPLLPQFHKLYPEAQVAISLDNSVIDLYNSPYHLAIRRGKLDNSDLIQRPLITDKGLLVASPSYLARFPQIRHPHDLKAHTCLTLQRQRQRVFWYFRQDEQCHKIQIDGALSACGGSALLEWARQGVGITLATDWLAQKWLESGELVEVLPQWKTSFKEQEETTTYLLWKADIGRQPVVRAMIEFLSQHLIQN